MAVCEFNYSSSISNNEEQHFHVLVIYQDINDVQGEHPLSPQRSKCQPTIEPRDVNSSILFVTGNHAA